MFLVRGAKTDATSSPDSNSNSCMVARRCCSTSPVRRQNCAVFVANIQTNSRQKRSKFRSKFRMNSRPKKIAIECVFRCDVSLHALNHVLTIHFLEGLSTQSRWRIEFRFAAHDGTTACLPLWRASLVILVVAPCLGLRCVATRRLALCGGGVLMRPASPLRRHGEALAAGVSHGLYTILLCKQMFVAHLIQIVAEFLSLAETKNFVGTFDDHAALDARLGALWPRLQPWINSRLPECDPRELGLVLGMLLLRPCETPPDPAFFDGLIQPALEFIPLPAGNRNSSTGWPSWPWHLAVAGVGRWSPPTTVAGPASGPKRSSF